MNLESELKGITVLSLEQAVSAPYCSMLLVESGARVIKVEPNSGDFARGYDSGADGESAIFAWLNRGKESICLDLNNSDDILLIKKILKKVDIFLNNVAPGVLDRKGLSLDLIRKLNSKIITCSISGYGSKGSARERKAYDFLIQGEVGLCSVTGTEKNPSRVGISIADISTGLTAFSGILRALIQRTQTNCGVDIKLSMFDVLSEWMNMPLISHRYLGGAPKRMALSHSFVSPYGVFETKDRKKILLSIQNNREWQIFCLKILRYSELINDPKFANNVERYRNRNELDSIIATVFKEVPKDTLVRQLTEVKIAFSNLNTVEDLAEHELLQSKDLNFGSAKISVADLPLPNRLSCAKTVPDLNQQEKSIRKEFGKD